MTRTRVVIGLASCLMLLLRAGPAWPDQETDGAETPATPTRPTYISIPEIFAELERPPVPFDHDRHTRALETEGCEVCHAKDEQGAFTFSYPKDRDETDAKALMNAFHDACMSCHQQRTAQKLKTGPLTCGECHHVEEEERHGEYRPVFPEYYNVLRDTYHRDCLVCHREPAKTAHEAKALNWKSFYVKQQAAAEMAWPKVSFDYAVHDKHEKVFEKKCELCHYLAPARREELQSEGKEPVCRDWLQELDPERSLTEREPAHARCVNCHLQRQAEKQKGGPLECGGCHTGRQRSFEELANVPRSACEQKEKMLIELKEGARAKAVPFNHKTHEANSRSCQECHHQTLRACRECHPLNGSEEGGWITLAEAYHSESSTWSCIGCHETVKQQPTCAGCHQQMESGLVKSSCNLCHTGTLQTLETVRKMPDPKGLLPEDTKDELAIAGLEKEYKPSKMPHLAIAKKLTELTNESPLANAFHAHETTICAGCHHQSPLEKAVALPPCSTCHPARMEAETTRPTLLGAYHQQCLRCHQQMVELNKKLPLSCTGCHEEKPVEPKG